MKRKMATSCVNALKILSRTGTTILHQQLTAGHMIKKWSKVFKSHSLEDYKLSAEYLVDFIANSKGNKVVMSEYKNTYTSLQ